MCNLLLHFGLWRRTRMSPWCWTRLPTNDRASTAGPQEPFPAVTPYPTSCPRQLSSSNRLAGLVSVIRFQSQPGPQQLQVKQKSPERSGWATCPSVSCSPCCNTRRLPSCHCPLPFPGWMQGDLHCCCHALLSSVSACVSVSVSCKG